MRTRFFASAALALLAPTALFAASARTAIPYHSTAAFSTVAGASESGAFDADADDPHCGRGRAWGCKRDRDDDRYDDRRDRGRDRHDGDRYDGDRWERERYERARYDRDRYERDRYRQDRYEQERYERERELERYRHRDRRYSRYDGYPVACVRAGGRVIGSVVLMICVP